MRKRGSAKSTVCQPCVPRTRVTTLVVRCPCEDQASLHLVGKRRDNLHFSSKRRSLVGGDLGVKLGNIKCFHARINAPNHNQADMLKNLGGGEWFSSLPPTPFAGVGYFLTCEYRTSSSSRCLRQCTSAAFDAAKEWHLTQYGNTAGWTPLLM